MIDEGKGSLHFTSIMAGISECVIYWIDMHSTACFLGLEYPRQPGFFRLSWELRSMVLFTFLFFYHLHKENRISGVCSGVLFFCSAFFFLEAFSLFFFSLAFSRRFQSCFFFSSCCSGFGGDFRRGFALFSHYGFFCSVSMNWTNQRR
jgi:hypothetical protein